MSKLKNVLYKLMCYLQLIRLLISVLLKMMEAFGAGGLNLKLLTRQK